MFTDANLGLLSNAVVAGVMLGGFYAAVSVGVTIAFGLLNVVNIAHPAFVLTGSYLALALHRSLGVDPLLGAVLLTPVFFVLGAGVYEVYHHTFERRGGESLRGLVFFFGVLFLIEAVLVAMFGVDFRSVNTSYTDTVWRVGGVAVPARLFGPFVISLVLIAGLEGFLQKSFFGRSIMAVGQDAFALALMGSDPVRVKRLAMGIAVASAAVAGSMLVIVQPVQPTLGREYIGMVFAVCVLGGMGSVRGSLYAALLLGLAETLTATFLGPSWAPAASFGLLLGTLAFRPSGIFAR